MKITRRQLRRIIRESSWGRSEHDAEASGMVASYRQGYSDGYENPRLQATTGRDPEYLRGYEKGAADAEDGRDEAKYIREAEGSTKKYDDDSALKGGQSKLHDKLQKAIIDKTVEDREEREEKNESIRITRRQLRRIIREATMYQLWANYRPEAIKAADAAIKTLDPRGERGTSLVGGMVEAEIHHYISTTYPEFDEDERFDVADEALTVASLMVGEGEDYF